MTWKLEKLMVEISTKVKDEVIFALNKCCTIDYWQLEGQWIHRFDFLEELILSRQRLLDQHWRQMIMIMTWKPQQQKRKFACKFHEKKCWINALGNLKFVIFVCWDICFSKMFEKHFASKNDIQFCIVCNNMKPDYLCCGL